MHFSITLAITLASTGWTLALTYLRVTTDLTTQQAQPTSTSVIVKCMIVLTTYLAIDGPFISAPLLFPPPNPYHLPNAQRQDWLNYQAFVRTIEPTLHTSNVRNFLAICCFAVGLLGVVMGGSTIRGAMALKFAGCMLAVDLVFCLVVMMKLEGYMQPVLRRESGRG